MLTFRIQLNTQRISIFEPVQLNILGVLRIVVLFKSANPNYLYHNQANNFQFQFFEKKL